MTERRKDRATRDAISHALERERRARVRSEVTRIGVLVLLVASVWVTGYQGRQDQVDVSRKACERGKLDRTANANGWRTAEQARRATANDKNNSGTERASAALAADSYADIARALEARSRIDCSVAFPGAKLLPF